MDINVPDKYKQEAYDLIRSIYKFIPYYNQIKGTYLGMQFILNMMGLCASITELWATRDNISNFSKDATFFREDEIYATRRFIDEIGNAKVKDYFLTSRFDVDINYKTGISLAEFNGMANTIVDVIMKIRPVTRCLRKLYFILLINTNIHFNYYLDTSDNNYEQVIEDGGPEPEENPYGLKFRTFNYIWDITGNPLAEKTDYDPNLKYLNCIFVPYLALGAKFYDNDTYTVQNTFFNLVDLDTKLRVSQWKQLRIKLFVRDKNQISIVKEQEYRLNIGSDIEIKMDRNGFFINFNGQAKTILGSFFAGLDLDKIDVYLSTTFTMVLGTKYLYQKFDIPLDWDIQELLNEYAGLITEASNHYEPVFLLSEKGDAILTYETDNYYR